MFNISFIEWCMLLLKIFACIKILAINTCLLKRLHQTVYAATQVIFLLFVNDVPFFTSLFYYIKITVTQASKCLN